MSPTVFRSKVDAWLLLTLGLSASLALVAAAVLAYEVRTAYGLINAIVTATLGCGLPIWLLASTYYRIDAQALWAHCGPFRYRIPLEQIRQIKPTRSGWSSPALSLDRLRIEFGEGQQIMVSPQDQSRFLRRLDEARRALT